MLLQTRRTSTVIKKEACKRGFRSNRWRRSCRRRRCSASAASCRYPAPCPRFLPCSSPVTRTCASAPARCCAAALPASLTPAFFGLRPSASRAFSPLSRLRFLPAHLTRMGTISFFQQVKIRSRVGCFHSRAREATGTCTCAKNKQFNSPDKIRSKQHHNIGQQKVTRGKTATLIGAMLGWKRSTERFSPPTTSSSYAEHSSAKNSRSTPERVTQETGRARG